MPTPRNYQTEAIVVRKTRLGEADRILTLFTPVHGKIEAVAKGVRRPRSKMAGHLELLTHSMVTLARGRNLDTITGSQTINGFLSLKDDLQLTSRALYLTELVNQFMTERQENQEVFQLLLECLNYLGGDSNKELVLRHFEMRLLDAAGYRPQLQQCVACRRPLEPVENAFSVSAGGVICPDCRSKQAFTLPISVNALKVMRFLQKNEFSTVNKLKLDDDLSWQVKHLLRQYIRHLLEREVKSTEWMDKISAADSD